MKWWVWTLLVALLLAGSNAALAQDFQEAAADSTEDESGGLAGLGAATMGRSAAVADSLRQEEERRARAQADGKESILESLAPTTKFTVNSDLQRVMLQGKVSAKLPVLFKASGTSDYTATNTAYRQQDRDQEQRTFTSSITDTLPLFGKLEVKLRHDTNYDENRPRTGSTIVLDYTEREASLRLGGVRDLGANFSHSWAAAGNFEDVAQINRQIRNDRSLAGGGITTQWAQRNDWFDVVARYGYQRRDGSRILAGLEADASAERDTLAIDAVVEPSSRLRLDFGGERATFTEDRLDFARNASGQVDTARALIKVANEHERSVVNKVEGKFDARAARWLSFDGSAQQSRTETEYTFSQQGVVLRDDSSLQIGAWLAYSAAGSVQVVYSYRDRSINRRIKGASDFRGKDSQRSYEARMKLQQRLFRESDVEFTASETLDQTIFGDPQNQGDRDRLYDRFDVKLKSDAIPYVGITVAGKMSQEFLRNIDAAKVSGNKDDALYEVSTRYTVDPPGGFFFTQNYRMQIKFVDQLASDDRDQFNKQGQVDSVVDYDFVNGVTTRFQYVLDFRSTGTRDATYTDRRVYDTTQRRFDHRLRGEVTVPLRWVDFNIRSERGFLQEENRRGELEESSGRINMKAAGTQRWLDGRVTLSLDVERVLQFGPRVRDEGRDYWQANSSMTVMF